MDKAILFGFSLCVTGFFTLVGWCWWLNWQMGKRVTYEWIENHFMKECEKRHKRDKEDFVSMVEQVMERLEEKHENDKANFDSKMLQLTSGVKEIRDALVGTVDKKGLITKIHEHDDRLIKLENLK